MSEELARLKAVGRTTCVGNGTSNSGCGYEGGQSGTSCPKCGGMLLSDKSQIEANSTALKWIEATVEAKEKALRAELAQLRADKERLDWLNSKANCRVWERAVGRWHVALDTFVQPNTFKGETLRAALDAAMRKEQP